MIRKDGRNVLRTPSLAETVMQPKDFPYTKQDLALAKTEQPYRVAKAHWPTPSRARTRQQRPHPRAGTETGGDPAMGDANGAGLEGRNADQQQRADGEQPFPPGPTDKTGWERFLRERPDLEPAVRGGADGLACRVDRLRLCGNGVVPLVAAYAFRTLASAAGIEFNES
jgi:hypothetical protein